jgi:GNAT superfamily N-acetyltransferase
MDVDLRPLDWTSAADVEAIVGIRLASHAADEPGDPALCPVWWSNEGAYPWPATAQPAWLLDVGGEPAGFVQAYLSLRENLDVYTYELQVHPAHRGRGVARAALAQVEEVAREEGRPRLLTEVAEDRGFWSFAAGAGYRPVLVDVQRRLVLADIDDGEHDALLADARTRSAGYSLVQWVGATPEDLIGDVAVLEALMSSDPPLDDLEWEPEAPDPDRVRERDRMVAGRGQRRYVTVVRDDATGAVVGSTSIVRSATLEAGGDQWETIVLEAHRGHRLGMRLKLENLRFYRAHEPHVRSIDTWNAESNTHMVAVNEALGFRTVRRWAEHERRLG